MLAIARFNWPFYAVAGLVEIGSCAVWIVAAGLVPKLIGAAAMAGSLYFLLGSLGVSYLIYDRSDLYRWHWLRHALPGHDPGRAISCHCGFDESSQSLRTHFATAEWLVLDHFNAAQMTEASIRRARRLFPPTEDALPAPSGNWPVEADFADAIFGMLAIHELRSPEARSAWFAEARRCLRRDGRIILVEHVRDLANFLAFGPGFMHFHSPKCWRKAWQSVGLRCIDEFCVTPWVRIFVLAA